MASPAASPAPQGKLGFRQELRLQRWDDHRYYHQSRINQSLHFFSSICFLTAYGLVFVSPAAAALVGWLLAMVSRQAGHFFFEPRSYDAVNQATHGHKEDIKVGYNLKRKRVLHGIWAATPIVLYYDPSMLGLVPPARGFGEYANNVALLWLYLGVGALLFRMAQLSVTRNVQTATVWVTKILTDPFHDFRIYAGAPAALIRGQLLDPMTHVPGRISTGGVPEAEVLGGEAGEPGHATR
ncbi:MAG: hypothetical protein PVF57_13605 [Pseudomonadales bacterium]|jgi:hypothetical protein